VSWDQLASFQQRGHSALVARIGDAPSRSMQTRITATRDGLFATTSLVVEETTYLEIIGKVGSIDLSIAAEASLVGSETELEFEILQPVRLGPYRTRIHAGDCRAENFPFGESADPAQNVDMASIAKCLAGVPSLFANCIGGETNVMDFWKPAETGTRAKSSRSVLA